MKMSGDDKKIQASHGSSAQVSCAMCSQDHHPFHCDQFRMVEHYSPFAFALLPTVVANIASLEITGVSGEVLGTTAGTGSLVISSRFKEEIKFVTQAFVLGKLKATLPC